MPRPLNLTISAATAHQWVPFLRRHLRSAHRLLPKAPSELSLALVGDARMSALHKQFMGIKGPTDVLTFDLDHDPRGRVSAGEIVICIPQARRAARRLGTDPRHEALLYALHGLLHLCGFDDRTDEDFRAMHVKEDDILARLGVGAVFAPAASVRRADKKR